MEFGRGDTLREGKDIAGGAGIGGYRERSNEISKYNWHIGLRDELDRGENSM